MTEPSPAQPSPLGVFERWLTLWVALAMIAGLALGALAPGVVQAIAAAEVASINPYGKTTPTVGRKRGFFDDLFGNIGAVGAAPGGAAGGSRDQP